MKNIFMTKGLYTTTEQMDYIMNCPTADHKVIYETIAAMDEATTDQVCKPFSMWINEDDKTLSAIGAVNPGDYVRRRIREEEYGEA